MTFDLDVVRENAVRRARREMGVGRADHTGTTSVGSSRAGWYPVLALGVLVAVDRMQSFAVFVLGPEIARGVGIDRDRLAALVALKTLAITLAAVPAAAFVQRVPRRAAVSIVSALAWSVVTAATGFVTTMWMLLVVFVLDGISTGSTTSVHHPLLVDSYEPTLRVRVMSIYESFAAGGNILSPLVVGVCVTWFDLTWRGVFLVLGSVCLLGALFAMRLRDPGFGTFDEQVLQDATRREMGLNDPTDRPDDIALGFFEVAKRIMLVPTARRVLSAWAVIGLALIPLTTYMFFFLDFRWNLSTGERSTFYAYVAITQVAALALVASPAQRRFSQDPAALLRWAALLLGSSMVSLAVGVLTPSFAAMVAFTGLAFALLGCVAPLVTVAGMSVLPPRLRPHFSALAGIAYSAVGGLGGILLLSGLDRRFGSAGAMAAIAGPGILCALIVNSAGRTVQADIARLADDTVEQEELRVARRSGRAIPLLEGKGIDFSYGSLQVLFGAGLTVHDGEVVALLGTNGAGKSTMLGVVSGLHLPSRGVVRLQGADITYVDAERRVGLGIAQIAGGQSTFSQLHVAEHLRAFGWTVRHDQRQIDAAIERSFEVFPALFEARHRPAVSLSGGQQQMLALTKALILQPRLLCIDELSLGLAPAVVTQLLEIIRDINRHGSAVVLVEQSVNVALSVADRAYFMEKGAVQFEGPAAGLLDRSDLLRSVFFGSASEPTATSPHTSPHTSREGT
ncbi:MAG: MFS transporter [Actinobacteria bacterium]|nr:MFS transporter [Actinomycetota bacterium]